MEYDIDFYKHFGWLKKVRCVHFFTFLHWMGMMWWCGVVCCRMCTLVPYFTHTWHAGMQMRKHVTSVWSRQKYGHPWLFHGGLIEFHIQRRSLCTHTCPVVKSWGSALSGRGMVIELAQRDRRYGWMPAFLGTLSTSGWTLIPLYTNGLEISPTTPAARSCTCIG